MQDGDRASFLFALARSRVLLALTADGAPVVAPGPYLLAYTSPVSAPTRSVGFAELADLPDGLGLVLDPGTPRETLLDTAGLHELAGLATLPVTPTEQRLARAVAAGDAGMVAGVLLASEVILPVQDDAGWPLVSGAAPAVPTSPVAAVSSAGHAVVAFTSWERYRQLVPDGAGRAHRFADLVPLWPPGAGLLLDPGLDHAAVLDPAAIAVLQRDVAP